jgi:hypothetical protein
MFRRRDLQIRVFRAKLMFRHIHQGLDMVDECARPYMKRS